MERLQAYPLAVLVLIPVTAILLGLYPFGSARRLTTILPDQKPANHLVVITSEPVEKAKSFRLDAILPTGENIFLYFEKDTLLPAYLDTVLVYTRLAVPQTPYSIKAKMTGYVPKGAWTILHPNTRPWYKTAKGWQLRLVARYRELGIAGQELATLSALTLGYRDDLEPDTKHAFQAAGAMHILAVSGLHTGILMTVLLALLTCFGRWKPLYDERLRQMLLSGAVVLLLWCYAALTGWTPSVVRSVIMCTIYMAAITFHRQGVSLNTVFAAAFFILIFRPMDLFSVSFQLSFAAVIAILIFVPVLNALIPIPYYWPKPIEKPLLYIRDLITVSLAAQAGTMPFTLYYYGQFSTYFLLTNLVVIPLAFVIIGLSIATLTIGAIPYVGEGLAYLLNTAVWCLNHYTAWIESLPFALITI